MSWKLQFGCSAQVDLRLKAAAAENDEEGHVHWWGKGCTDVLKRPLICVVTTSVSVSVSVSSSYTYKYLFNLIVDGKLSSSQTTDILSKLSPPTTYIY